MNPYLSRVMIQDPAHFFGRGRESSRIFSRIGADRPQSVSLVGERRIGKSSLLYHLTTAAAAQKYLADRNDLVIAFVDFQQLGAIALNDFFSFLFSRISPAAIQPSAHAKPGFREFSQFVEELAGQGKRLVLLFDEFDLITSNPAFTSEFYSFMRSIANHYPVAYVTSSKLELQKLCHSSEIADSPFFNIFTNLYLGTFESAEAVDLIRDPSAAQGVPLASFEQDILRLAGFFPLYLQIACSIYFEEAQQTTTAELDRERMESLFLEEAGPHFEYIWNHMSEPCRQTTRRVLSGDRPLSDELHLCRRLQKEGYLVREGEEWRLFSPPFADYIRGLEKVSPSSRFGVTANKPGDPLPTIHQYRILEEAQSGGMGVVYRALDTSLQRPVAIKFIRPGLLVDDTTRRRFYQEARTAASLSHPAIMSIYEFFEHEGQAVLVMEWISGRTLKELIIEEGPFHWQRLAEWLKTACDALEAAHQQGVIHRDIKSSNLMITSGDALKIMDFGLAKQVTDQQADPHSSELTAQGGILGTLNYMSPEQARGEPVDARSDLFSLGVVFFEALTGRIPFQRSTPTAQLHALLNEPVPSLGFYGVEEAERLDRIVGKLLEKTSSRRYSNARGLKNDLESLQQKRHPLFFWRS